MRAAVRLELDKGGLRVPLPDLGLCRAYLEELAGSSEKSPIGILFFKKFGHLIST